jgi:hypothetical protein
MNVSSLTSFALSYKEEESTIQTILATVINASVYDSTAPSNPDNRRYTSSQRRPAVYRALGYSNPPSSAMRRLPNLSSYLCSLRLQNCRGEAPSRIPGYCRGGRRMLNTSHWLSCQFSSRRPPMPLHRLDSRTAIAALSALHRIGPQLGFN